MLHKIELTDEQPFKQKKPQEFPTICLIKSKISYNNLLTLISYPWASNTVVLCRKEDKTLVMRIDYIELNNGRDSNAFPRTDDILEALSNNKFLPFWT